ncbi:MAG: NfeD family protein [Pseudomonadota bacterium]|nr:NfeD family protein [Pseudomonadota bacterium]
MRWEVFAWGAAALSLMALETIVPGAALMWLGFAAAGVFLVVLAFPDASLLLQMSVFAALSFVSIVIYWQWFRGRQRVSDHPTLNQRAAQHIGKQLVLERAIEGGTGRVKIGDAFWQVSGPDLPIGARVRVVEVDGMALRVEAV